MSKMMNNKNPGQRKLTGVFCCNDFYKSSRFNSGCGIGSRYFALSSVF